MKFYSVFFVFSLLGLACTTPDIKKEVVVIEADSDTSSENDGTVIEDTDSDSDTEGDVYVKHATTEYCSVEIVFYFEGDICTSIELANYNDAAVVVDIYNTTTGGTMLQNCLWPQNDIFGGTDEESVNFSSSDNLELEIWLGQGISADICSESITDLFDSFELCESHEISFVFK